MKSNKQSAHVREYRYKGELVAVLMERGFVKRGQHAVFISEPGSSLQLGAVIYPKSHIGEPHEHDRTGALEAHYEEIVHLDSGRMEVSLFGGDGEKFASFVMRGGDTIHLISGGHGFKMLSDCRCIEVKQGPFVGQNKRFFARRSRS